MAQSLKCAEMAFAASANGRPNSLLQSSQNSVVEILMKASAEKELRKELLSLDERRLEVFKSLLKTNYCCDV